MARRRRRPAVPVELRQAIAVLALATATVNEQVDQLTHRTQAQPAAPQDDRTTKRTTNR
jgi:hypothetical protein